MMVVNTADLYTVRDAVVKGRVNSLTLSFIDRVIAHNAHTQFVDDVIYEQVMEALRAINGEAVRGYSAVY